jgi:hypothetical protein
MNSSGGRFVTLLAFAFLSGCAHPRLPVVQGPIEGMDQNYVPMVPGKEWTYHARVDGSDGADDIRVGWRIVSVRATPQGTEFTWEIQPDGRPAERQIWLATNKGLYETADGIEKTVFFEPPQPIFEYPLRAGNTFQWSGNGLLPNGKPGYSNLNGKVDAVENVTTPSGTVGAIPVEYSMTGSGIDTSIKVWFTPGIGVVQISEIDKFDKKTDRSDCILENVQ